MGDAAPGQVFLGCVRKQTDQVRESKPGISVYGLRFRVCSLISPREGLQAVS